MYSNSSTMNMSAAVLRSFRGESGLSYQGPLLHGAGAAEAANERLASEVYARHAQCAVPPSERVPVPRALSPPAPITKHLNNKVAEATRRRVFLEETLESMRRAKYIGRYKFFVEELEMAKRAEKEVLREKKAAEAVKAKTDSKAEKMRKRETALKGKLGKLLDIKLRKPRGITNVAKKKKSERVKGIAYVTSRRRESEKD